MKVGPTVAPAFSLENYHGLQNIEFGQALRILENYTRMLFSGDQRKLIWAFLTQEMPKLSINRIVSDVSKIHQMNAADFPSFYRPGIRAQLINKKTLKMQNDFILEFPQGENHCHILNLVSPGWTCALPFADYIVE